MATIINFNSFVNGLATDVTSVELESADGTYGLKRTDDGAPVVLPGTDLTRLSPGSYQYIVTDPAPDLTYDYVLKVIYNGVTYYYPRVAASGSTYNHIFSVPTNAYYSSEAEVMRMLGESGIEAMLEDWESSDTSPVWKQILRTVDSRIDQYAGQRYDRSSIVDNDYIRTNATLLACHLLSMRRGNPGTYINESNRIQDELDQIRVGRLHIPGAGTRANFAPQVRNQRMTAFPFHPLRTIYSKSTGTDNPPVGINYYSWEPFFYGYQV